MELPERPQLGIEILCTFGAGVGDAVDLGDDPTVLEQVRFIAFTAWRRSERARLGWSDGVWAVPCMSVTVEAAVSSGEGVAGRWASSSDRS